MEYLYKEPSGMIKTKIIITNLANRITMDYLYKVPSAMIKTKIIIINLANDAVSVH